MLAWAVGIAALMLVLWVAMRPISFDALKSHPGPRLNYTEALEKIKAMQLRDNEAMVWDVCISKVFEHGAPTQNALVLLHGFTNCPEQFTRLGQQCYEAGFNVFIPRLPQHGSQDRLTDALAQLRTEDLTTFGDEVIDIARGLGQKVSVLGISGGGTLAAWLAQTRSDVDYAFPLAALQGVAFIHRRLTSSIQRFAKYLPNFFIWWDPRTKAENPFSIYHAYPRYPLSGILETLRLAFATERLAHHHPPAAGRIVMIINAAEPGVSNPALQHLLSLWSARAPERVSVEYFEKEMNLPHDIITPGTPGVPLEDVYERLLKIIRQTVEK
jgi:carboxylesterase